MEIDKIHIKEILNIGAVSWLQQSFKEVERSKGLNNKFKKTNYIFNHLIYLLYNEHEDLDVKKLIKSKRFIKLIFDKIKELIGYKEYEDVFINIYVKLHECPNINSEDRDFEYYSSLIKGKDNFFDNIDEKHIEDIFEQGFFKWEKAFISKVEILEEMSDRIEIALYFFKYILYCFYYKRNNIQVKKIFESEFIKIFFEKLEELIKVDEKFVKFYIKLHECYGVKNSNIDYYNELKEKYID